MCHVYTIYLSLTSCALFHIILYIMVTSALDLQANTFVVVYLPNFCIIFLLTVAIS